MEKLLIFGYINLGFIFFLFFLDFIFGNLDVFITVCNLVFTIAYFWLMFKIDYKSINFRILTLFFSWIQILTIFWL